MSFIVRGPETEVCLHCYFKAVADLGEILAQYLKFQWYQSVDGAFRAREESRAGSVVSKTRLSKPEFRSSVAMIVNHESENTKSEYRI